MLVSWDIGKESNAHMFWQASTMPTIVAAKIKEEAENWVTPRTMYFSEIVP
jgi:hypothetical protein